MSIERHKFYTNQIVVVQLRNHLLNSKDVVIFSTHSR